MIWPSITQTELNDKMDKILGKTQPLAFRLNLLVMALWPWGRIRRLRLALDAATDAGIYPQAVRGHKDSAKNYEKRSEYQNGWNDCAMQAVKRMDGILKARDW